ncbi:MAG: amino acid dehydrogenase [Parcubacteria group bacterium]|nr:amino acid dehydrogenase [Parcubacteria group bacterium]
MIHTSIEALPEFDEHKLVVFVHDKKGRLRGFIAVHRSGAKNLSFGGTRFLKYDTTTDALRDALRLSKMMSYKCALAGINYGGAKGVIIDNPKLSSKKDVIVDYARAVDYLGGRYISGADVGITWEDSQIMKHHTPYVGGFSRDITKETGAGIMFALEACLQEVFGSAKLEERTFAIQGIGKIGADVLARLYPQAKEIIIADIDPKKTAQAKKKFPKVRIVKPEEITSQKADVFVPCALSGVLNKKILSSLKCKIICGGANNQLKSDDVAVKLHAKHILYAPDYAVNAGGLISVIDEHEYKDYNDERIVKRLENIKHTLKNIFTQSKKKNISPVLVANKIAESFFQQN